jgi:hypothetical protein
MTRKLGLTSGKIALSRASYAHNVVHRTYISDRMPGTPASSVQRIVFQSKLETPEEPPLNHELRANGVWMRFGGH